jgi:hypothetical protein
MPPGQGFGDRMLVSGAEAESMTNEAGGLLVEAALACRRAAWVLNVDPAYP